MLNCDVWQIWVPDDTGWYQVAWSSGSLQVTVSNAEVPSSFREFPTFNNWAPTMEISFDNGQSTLEEDYIFHGMLGISMECWGFPSSRVPYGAIWCHMVPLAARLKKITVGWWNSICWRKTVFNPISQQLLVTFIIPYHTSYFFQS